MSFCATALIADYREGRELRFDSSAGDPPRWTLSADDRPAVEWQGWSLLVGERDFTLGPDQVLILDHDGRPRAISGTGR